MKSIIRQLTENVDHKDFARLSEAPQGRRESLIWSNDKQKSGSTKHALIAPSNYVGRTARWRSNVLLIRFFVCHVL